MKIISNFNLHDLGSLIIKKMRLRNVFENIGYYHFFSMNPQLLADEKIIIKSILYQLNLHHNLETLQIDSFDEYRRNKWVNFFAEGEGKEDILKIISDAYNTFGYYLIKKLGIEVARDSAYKIFCLYNRSKQANRIPVKIPTLYKSIFIILNMLTEQSFWLDQNCKELTLFGDLISKLSFNIDSKKIIFNQSFDTFTMFLNSLELK